MITFLKKIRNFFSSGFTWVHLKNITNSRVSVNIVKRLEIIARPKFILSDNWFNEQLKITYDEEIRNKYIPDLHQTSEFERIELSDILEFSNWKAIFLNQIRICSDYLDLFFQEYRDFYQILETEDLKITDSKYPSLNQINALHSSIQDIISQLSGIQTLLELEGYKVLSYKSRLTPIEHPMLNSINFSRDNWVDFIDKEPADYYTLRSVFRTYDLIYYNLREVNLFIHRFDNASNHKIIVGNAGTGKTHISAHLINTLQRNGDKVIFFKAKQFSGDNIDLEYLILQALQIPHGYNLSEILQKINEQSQNHNIRCFFIFDALNETTKSSIGFSNIWSTHLQEFINQIKQYSHLYLICTLRTSYIDNIWPVRPTNIVDINGFQKPIDLKEACIKYFNYYKIKPLNFETADLSYFTIPLLLDLFCKFTNETREHEKEISLDINTYLQIFESYIKNLVVEVKKKLNLQKSKPIINGLAECSDKFLSNNEAIITLDEFSDAFDKNDVISQDESIARAILEGYLIYIKDFLGKTKEIVKHTQQEVGGYLLAKRISDNFSSITDLITSQDIVDKILGTDPAKFHQLRLDVLKFLVAIRPEIIIHLKGKDSLLLSWWYLYNGFDDVHQTTIPNFLVSSEHSKTIIESILNVSRNYWFNIENKHNFHFIAQLLEKLTVWEFDEYWTYYIYKENEFISSTIQENLELLRISKQSDSDYFTTVSKFVAFTNSTNIRNLRDYGSKYLIEWGKKFPLDLLSLTVYTSTIKDSYIYERLTSICYGVSLIFQNDEDFIHKYLPEFANQLYNLQFAANSSHSVYNYIVTDSIKHLVDLALSKSVFNLNADDKKRLDIYEFKTPYEWIPPDQTQIDLINSSHETSWPEPIGMDFGIYTIPRLVNIDERDTRELIAHVYKRIFEFGYKKSENLEILDERFRDFYYGHDVYGFEGKVDRLGKKYSWKGFFDYAGVLLKKGELDVFKSNEKEEPYYDRLSDVDIDICLPNLNYKLPIRIYHEDLLGKRDHDPEWYREVFIDSIAPLFEHSLKEDQYTMLHGFAEQRVNNEYKIRSFLMAETFLIEKNSKYEQLKQILPGQTFNWDSDLHSSKDHLSSAYFGELYWADNMPRSSLDEVLIPTGKMINIKRRIGREDIFVVNGSNIEDWGKLIEESRPEKLRFNSEPTLVEYLWESDSVFFKGYSEYYPSIKMGKYLNLKSDPSSGMILDSTLKECFQCIDLKEKYFQNSFNYIRSDLLKKYMQENNLALLYQVKQHSYDENFLHNRSMKFFIKDF